MLSRSFSRPLSIAAGAGAALTSFGVVAPADATVNCADGVTVDANELEIRLAIDAGEEIICINPGTVDMSSAGTDGSADPFGVEQANLALVALGDVTFDGGGEEENAILSFGNASENLLVDGITFTGFNNNSTNPFGVVNLDGSNGTLTVLNSTFTGNSGYAMAFGSDTDDETNYADVFVDNSVFDDNTVWFAQVWGKADVTVSSSSFTGSNGHAISSDDDLDGDTVTEIFGNYFADNVNDGSVMGSSTDTTLIYNNTFSSNVATTADNGVAIEIWGGTSNVIAHNTFVDNDSEQGEEPAVFVESGSTASVIGNIFASSGTGYGVDSTDVGAVTDAGGNFSTSDDSGILDGDNSRNNVSLNSLDVADADDNGGTTFTAALGSSSVAIDAVPTADAEAALGFALNLDQRGEDRVGPIDAGAYEFGSALAATGVDATGIALTGGALGVAGVAIAARRRRNA